MRLSLSSRVILIVYISFLSNAEVGSESSVAFSPGQASPGGATRTVSSRSIPPVGIDIGGELGSCSSRGRRVAGVSVPPEFIDCKEIDPSGTSVQDVQGVDGLGFDDHNGMEWPESEWGLHADPVWFHEAGRRQPSGRRWTQMLASSAQPKNCWFTWGFTLSSFLFGFFSGLISLWWGLRGRIRSKSKLGGRRKKTRHRSHSKSPRRRVIRKSQRETRSKDEADDNEDGSASFEHLLSGDRNSPSESPSSVRYQDPRLSLASVANSSPGFSAGHNGLSWTSPTVCGGSDDALGFAGFNTDTSNSSWSGWRESNNDCTGGDYFGWDGMEPRRNSQHGAASRSRFRFEGQGTRRNSFPPCNFELDEASTLFSISKSTHIQRKGRSAGSHSIPLVAQSSRTDGSTWRRQSGHKKAGLSDQLPSIPEPGLQSSRPENSVTTGSSVFYSPPEQPDSPERNQLWSQSGGSPSSSGRKIIRSPAGSMTTVGSPGDVIFMPDYVEMRATMDRLTEVLAMAIGPLRALAWACNQLSAQAHSIAAQVQSVAFVATWFVGRKAAKDEWLNMMDNLAWGTLTMNLSLLVCAICFGRWQDTLDCSIYFRWYVLSWHRVLWCYIKEPGLFILGMLGLFYGWKLLSGSLLNRSQPLAVPLLVVSLGLCGVALGILVSFLGGSWGTATTLWAAYCALNVAALRRAGDPRRWEDKMRDRASSTDEVTSREAGISDAFFDGFFFPLLVSILFPAILGVMPFWNRGVSDVLRGWAERRFWGDN